jgi:hypothetical protein
MRKIANEDPPVVTVSVKCKHCSTTLEKRLPKAFVEACDQAGAEGFTGTCPKCAAADPIFRSLHPHLGSFAAGVTQEPQLSGMDENELTIGDINKFAAGQFERRGDGYLGADASALGLPAGVWPPSIYIEGVELARGKAVSHDGIDICGVEYMGYGLKVWIYND